MSYQNNYNTRSRSSILYLKITERSIFNEWMLYWNRQLNKRVKLIADLYCRVDGKLYPVHSKLFSFWSPVFETKFQRDFHNIVNIPTIKPFQFEIIVNYIYSAKLKLTHENILAVLHAADYLEIDSITEACKYYVVSNVKIIDNIFDIYKFLGNKPNSRVFSDMKTGILKSWRYIRYKHDINRLSFYNMKDLVERLSESSEKWSDLIEICLDWVMFDFETRAKCVPELMRCICGRQVECDVQQLVKENLGNIFRRIYICFEDDPVRFAEFLGLTRQSRTDFHDDVKPPKSIEIFYYRSWQKRMEILRSENQSDLIVHVKNKTYFLNTWVLSISSRFFRRALPSSSIEIVLEEDDFETVLNYMYGKNLRINLQNIEGVLRAYYYLEIDSIKMLIIDFLRGNITHLPNIFKLFELSMQNTDEIQFFLRNHLLRHFSEISQNKIVHHLSKNCLNILLSSEFGRISNEQKFVLCEIWIKDDFENRFKFADQLLRLMNCSSEEMSQFHARLNKNSLPIVMNEKVEIEEKINNGKKRKLENFPIPFAIKVPKLNEDSSKNSEKWKESGLKFYNNFYIRMKPYDFSNEKCKN